MNKSFHKNKYQMPNIDSLLQMIFQNLIVNAVPNDSRFEVSV